MATDPRAGPLTSREALLFEDVAGCSVLAALQALREGTTPTGACVAACLVAGRRRADDVTVEDVLDTYPGFAELADVGGQMLTRLLMPEYFDDAEGDR